MPVEAIKFIVDHDHTADDDGEEQLVGWITASVQTRPGDFRARVVGGPTPRTINLPTRKGYLAADGHMYKDQAMSAPFRLTANDPMFNLEHLTYRFDFDLTTLIGVPVPVPSCYAPAPSTATTLYLTKVMNDVDQPVMEVRTKGYAEDILDATELGVAMVTADDAESFRDITDSAGGFSTAEDGQDTAINDGKLKARDPLYIDPTQAPYNVKFDRYTTLGAAMSSVTSPTHLTVSDPTGYTFTAADIGKVVKVAGAGAAGGNLKTTIVGVSAGKAVLASPCLTTVSGAFAMFGTDNAAALDLLFADLSYKSFPRKLSRIAVMPPGCAMYSGTLYFPAMGTLKGSTENWIATDLMYGNNRGTENAQGTILYQIWDQNVDCARVRPIYPPDGTDWNGKLQGFLIEQDKDNTAGNGLVFRTSSGSTVKPIDGGVIDRVSVCGAAQAGFDFPAGSLPITFRDLHAFACGYMDRKTFTANTTSGSATIASVSSFTGLVVGDILSSPGLPVDSTIQSMNSGAGTITMTRPATATATGISVQRMGSPGVRYTVATTEPVHFDGLAGDQNSGGLLRLIGNGAYTVGFKPAITITNLKNEFGANVYREPIPSVAPSVPQGSNAIVLEGMRNAGVSIRGLSHWADGSSSVANNSKGCDIGAAILDVATDGDTADVTWEALGIRFASGSGQTVGYAFRDEHSVDILPIATNPLSGKGANRPNPRPLRLIADVNATLSAHDSILGWSSLTTARTAALPTIASVNAGFEITLVDMSGSASDTVTITATSSDTILGDHAVNSPFGRVRLVSNGTAWLSVADTWFPKVSRLLDTNGVRILSLSGTASAVNYLEVINQTAGSGPVLAAKGSDTDISVVAMPKGTGGFQIYALTGVTPRVTAVGADTNINLNLQSKGTGVVQANGVEVMTVTSTHAFTSKATPVDADEIALVDSAASNAMKKLAVSDFAAMLAARSETLANKTMTAPKFANNGYIADANGNEQIVFVTTTSAVNGIKVTNAATGNRPTIAAWGDDTNVDLNLVGQGSGEVRYNGLSIATRSGTETFTNKTLTSPKVTSGNAPATSSSTGTAGQIEWDSGFLYVCTAANTWKRTALSTF